MTVDNNRKEDAADAPSVSSNDAWRKYLARRNGGNGRDDAKKVAQGSSSPVLAPSSPRYSSWASMNDLRDNFEEVRLCEDSEQSPGGVVVFSERITGEKPEVDTFVDTSSYHTMIVASTGAGKTRRVLMPSILSIIKAGESLVVNDPKGEIISMFYDMLQERGYEVRILNTRDPESGDCWNPFSQPYKLWHGGNEDEARAMLADLASSLYPPTKANDPYWDNVGEALLYGLMCAMVGRARTEGECNFFSLAAFLTKVTDDQSSIDRFLNSFSEDSSERQMLSAGLINADSTRRCVLSNARTTLGPLVNSPEINRMLSSNDFDMSTLGLKKTAFFLISSDEKDTYNVIIGRFIEQMNMMLFSAAYESENKSLPIRVNVLLDEMTSLTHIRNIPNMLVAGRSRNVRYTLVLQSTSQLAIYGDQSRDIVSNCQNWIFMSGRDMDFADTLRKICGEGKTGESLITVPQLLHLRTGEALVISGRMYPFVAKLADISEFGISGTVKIPEKVHPSPKIIGDYALGGRKRSYSLSDLFVDDDERDTTRIGPGDSFADSESIRDYVIDRYDSPIPDEFIEKLLELGQMLDEDMSINEMFDLIDASYATDDTSVFRAVLRRYVSESTEELYETVDPLSGILNEAL